jgi:methyl-accepting chemotaxis protein
VTDVKGLVDNVSVASKQQALGIDQVVQSIRQMERVTQTTAATAEECAAACEQLNTQADVTMGLVERLELMVGRNGARPMHATTQAKSARTRTATLLPVGRQPTRPYNASAEERAAFGDTGTYGKF